METGERENSCVLFYANSIAESCIVLVVLENVVQLQHFVPPSYKY